MIYLFFAKLSAVVASFLLLAVISTSYGVSAAGQYVTIFAISSLLAIVSNFGFYEQILKERIAGKALLKIIKRFFYVGICVNLGSWALLVDRPFWLLISCITITYVNYRLMSAAFLVGSEFKKNFWVSFFFGFVPTFATIICVISLSLPFESVLLLHCILNSIAFILISWPIKFVFERAAEGDNGPNLSPTVNLRLWSFGLSGIFTTQGEVLVLSAIASNEVVGIYGILFRFANVINIVKEIVTNRYLGSLYITLKAKRGDLTTLNRQVTKYQCRSFLLILSYIVITIIFMPVISHQFQLGADYTAEFVTLSCALAVWHLIGPVEHYLIAFSNENFLAIINIVIPILFFSLISVYFVEGGLFFFIISILIMRLTFCLSHIRRLYGCGLRVSWFGKLSYV